MRLLFQTALRQENAVLSHCIPSSQRLHSCGVHQGQQVLIVRPQKLQFKLFPNWFVLIHILTVVPFKIVCQIYMQNFIK